MAPRTREPTEILNRVWRRLAAPYPELAAFQVGINYGKPVKCGRVAWGLRHGASNDVVILNADDLTGDGILNAPRLLAHELAHLLAAVENIDDTSKDGAYHNARFKEMANRIGLPVVYTGATHGWCPDPRGEVPTTAALLNELGSTRVVELPKRRSRNNLKTQCECERIVRMSASTYAEAGIRCLRCGGLFTVVE